MESEGEIHLLAISLTVLLLLSLSNNVNTLGYQDIEQTEQSEPASVVWSDDFGDGNYNGWTVNRGGYSAADGAMRGTTSTFNWAHHSSTTATGMWTFDFYFRGTNGMVVWFICNNLVAGDYNRPKDGYGVEITLLYTEDYPLLRLWKNVADSESVLDSYDFGEDASGWWHFEVTRNESNEIRVYLNDTLRLSATDSAHSSSSYFYLHGYNTQAIDNIIIDDESPAITTSATTSTTTSSNSMGIQNPLFLLSAGGLALAVVLALVFVARRKHGRAPVHQTGKSVATEPTESGAPLDTTESRELVLGALKSYPRVSMKELSELLKLPVDQVRRITLRLIAAGSITGAFDRSMDEFVSVSASEVGRELKADDGAMRATPHCPHCGAQFPRQVGIGETVRCDSCGKTFSG